MVSLLNCTTPKEIHSNEIKFVVLDNDINMKLRELEQILEDVDDFSDPKINLEQYKTRPHLAACLLHSANQQYEDIEGKVVLDLAEMMTYEISAI